MLVRGAVAPTFLMVFGSAVARVAVVQYYFLTLDLHAIFNVFLCYTLLHADFPHGHGWLERKRRRLIKPFCRVSRTSLELEYITSSGPGPRPGACQHFGRIIARLAHPIASPHS